MWVRGGGSERLRLRRGLQLREAIWTTCLQV